MKHSETFLETMAILKPLFRLYPRYCVMPTDELYDTVAYYWNRGTISFVIDSQGYGRAVCMVRLFQNFDYFDVPFVHDPGKYCFIDLLVALDKESWRKTFDDLSQRWGPQEIVMWDRGDRTAFKAPRMYRWDQFIKLARRITEEENSYGRLPTTT